MNLVAAGSPYVLQLALAVVLAFVVSLVVHLLVHVFVRMFPTRLELEDVVDQLELEEIYAEELARVARWEYLFTFAVGIATPLSFLVVARWIIVRGVPTPNVLVHTGALMLAIPLFIAGVLIGVGMVPGIIEKTFSYPHSTVLVELYRRSEDLKYGCLGGLLLTKSRSLSAFIILTAIILGGNRYTLVAVDRIDLPAPWPSWQRELVPPADVDRLVELRRLNKRGQRSGPEYLVSFRDGRTLSSSSTIGRTGELADLLNMGDNAVELLSRTTGLPIERITLEPGQLLSAYDLEEARRQRKRPIPGV